MLRDNGFLKASNEQKVWQMDILPLRFNRNERKCLTLYLSSFLPRALAHWATQLLHDNRRTTFSPKAFHHIHVMSIFRRSSGSVSLHEKCENLLLCLILIGLASRLYVVRYCDIEILRCCGTFQTLPPRCSGNLLCLRSRLHCPTLLVSYFFV